MLKLSKCCIYAKFIKMGLMNLFAGQQWRCRQRIGLWTQSQGALGKERVGQMEREAWKHKHYYA